MKRACARCGERNPYYWCVDKEGNQLPYIDKISMTGVQNAESLKLSFTSGKADFDLPRRPDARRREHDEGSSGQEQA